MGTAFHSRAYRWCATIALLLAGAQGCRAGYELLGAQSQLGSGDGDPSGDGDGDGGVGGNLSGDGDGDGDGDMSTGGAGNSVTMEATTGIMPASTTSSPGAFGRDSWHCAVLRVEVTDPGGFEIDINGSTSLLATGGDTDPGNGFNRAFAGIAKTSHPSVEVYLDDITIAAERLACQ